VHKYHPLIEKREQRSLLSARTTRLAALLAELATLATTKVMRRRRTGGLATGVAIQLHRNLSTRKQRAKTMNARDKSKIHEINGETKKQEREKCTNNEIEFKREKKMC
jgi:hypothetical protein